MTARATDIEDAATRDASNRLLAVLSDGGWRPAAWVRFLVLATQRSVRQAQRHPRAFVESTALHVGIALFANRRGLTWIVVSWLMAVTHLGMLEGRRSIGLPNALTLVRGNLPAIEHRLGRALPILSLATDFADGKLARATGAVTSFGVQADFLADTAFWSWFIARYEPSRTVKVLTACAWAAPVAAVAIASFAKGRMLDIPRSAWFRPAAAMEVFVGTRAILRLYGRRAPSMGDAESATSCSSLLPSWLKK